LWKKNQSLTIKHKLAYTPSGLGFGLTPNNFSPAIDKVTIDNGMYIFVDVPGVEELHVELISSMDNVSHLILKGKRVKPDCYDPKADVNQERQFGDFEKTIPISSALRLLHEVKYDNVLSSSDVGCYYTENPVNGVVCIKLVHHLRDNMKQPSFHSSTKPVIDTLPQSTTLSDFIPERGLFQTSPIPAVSGNQPFPTSNTTPGLYAYSSSQTPVRAQYQSASISLPSLTSNQTPSTPVITSNPSNLTSSTPVNISNPLNQTPSTPRIANPLNQTSSTPGNTSTRNSKTLEKPKTKKYDNVI